MVAKVPAAGLEIQKPDGSMRQIRKARVAKVYLIGKSQELHDGLIGARAGAVAGPLSATEPRSMATATTGLRTCRFARTGVRPGLRWLA